MPITENTISDAAPGIGRRAASVLREMYTADALPGRDGERVPLQPDTRVPVKQGAVLHNLIRESGYRHTLEIGLAYGFSTVWMMAALPDEPEASHVAIDPFELTAWSGVGLAQVARLDARATFRWLESPSILALTEMVRRSERVDLAYIDGNHRFDDVLVDFYLADMVVRSGGLIALDDLWMPSIRSVLSFVLANRAYSLVPQPAENMAVLRKVREDDRRWDNFVPFRVRGKGLTSVDYVLRWLGIRLRGRKARAS